MTKRGFPCGCVWVKSANLSRWRHIVACPQHVMIQLPKTAPILMQRDSDD